MVQRLVSLSSEEVRSTQGGRQARAPSFGVNEISSWQAETVECLHSINVEAGRNRPTWVDGRALLEGWTLDDGVELYGCREIAFA